MENLNIYKNDITSQGGENGILIEIFQRLQTRKGVCIEFGAGDGKKISNTHPLWHDAGWSAVLIEPSKCQYDKTIQYVKEERESPNSTCGSVVTQRIYVTHDGPMFVDDQLVGNTFDAILDELNNKTKLSDFQHIQSNDIDLLSIDIDGNDYHVWKSIEKYNAKCVVIEYNSQFPLHYHHIDPPGDGMRLGASIKAFIELAKEKNYTLVAATSSNLIFVQNNYVHMLGNICTDERELYDHSWCTYVIGEMSGRRAWITRKSPWHYNIVSDQKMRRSIPSRPLYPVHLHYADRGSIEGKFRIQNGELHVHALSKENDCPYTNLQNSFTTIVVSLHALLRVVQRQVSNPELFRISQTKDGSIEKDTDRIHRNIIKKRND